MEKKLEESPLGWTIVLLFIILNAAEVLTYDIDDQLQDRFGPGNGFDPQKKYWLKHYYRCMKQARHWLEEMFKIDEIVWESTDQDSRRYTNAMADSSEIIRILMLYLDRALRPADMKISFTISAPFRNRACSLLHTSAASRWTANGSMPKVTGY